MKNRLVKIVFKNGEELITIRSDRTHEEINSQLLHFGRDNDML